MKTARGCFAAWLAWLWCALAHAQSGELALVLPNCPGREAWQHEVRELFELEVHVELSSQPPNTALPMLSVEQACDPQTAQALLRFRDPRTATDDTRMLSLRDAPPELRARVLALALAELLRSHWSPAAEGGAESPPPAAADESAEKPATAPAQVRDPPPVTIPSSERSEKPPARESAFTLSLGPSLHVYFAHGSLLYGAELSLCWWRLHLGVLGSLGSNSDTALGQAHYRRVHGVLSFDIARLALGAFTWAAAVRGALGGTFAGADAQTSVSSATASDVSYDGSLETWLALRSVEGWGVRLRADLGYALGPRYFADGRVLADFSGLFLGVALDLTSAL